MPRRMLARNNAAVRMSSQRKEIARVVVLLRIGHKTATLHTYGTLAA